MRKMYRKPRSQVDAHTLNPHKVVVKGVSELTLNTVKILSAVTLVVNADIRHIAAHTNVGKEDVRIRRQIVLLECPFLQRLHAVGYGVSRDVGLCLRRHPRGDGIHGHDKCRNGKDIKESQTCTGKHLLQSETMGTSRHICSVKSITILSGDDIWTWTMS